MQHRGKEQLLVIGKLLLPIKHIRKMTRKQFVS